MAVQGNIVIVLDLLDPQGRNPKDRACVLASSPERIAAGGPLEVIAITTLLPDPLSSDHVLLPWHAQRHPRTGLQRLTVGMHPVGSAIADLFVPNEEVRNSGPYENRARPESEPL